MKKKTDESRVDKMQLEYYEVASLQELSDMRMALTELEAALLPFAQLTAKKQREWWNRVLGDRGLKGTDGSYSTDGQRIIFEPHSKKIDNAHP